MNRRVFLAALGAVATQQKLGTFSIENTPAEAVQPQQFVTVARFPYVQNVQHDRASLLWATYEAGFGQVQYSSDGVNFNTVTATSRFFSTSQTGLQFNIVQYQADLTRLTPNTQYVYHVLVNGEEVNVAGFARFRTAGPGWFNFIALGDSGWGDPRSEAQGLIAQRIFAENAAFLIHTGDLAYPMGSHEYYQRNYFNYYAATMSSVPIFPAMGNHEYDVANALPYLALHSVPGDNVPPQDRGRYYSYDWGNVHIVSIDAHQSLDRAVNADGSMLRWLNNDLRSTRQFWRVVYFHYPPFATGVNVNDIQSAWVRQYLVPILENYGVQLVFCGHEHSYQRGVPIRKSSFTASSVGTNYFVSGGGGATLYPVPEKPTVAFARSTYHYLRVEVQGTRINVHSIRQDGVIFDSVAIAPAPAFSDDARVPPATLTPGAVAGATIRIGGRALAAEESFPCTPVPPTEMAGTVVTVNGVPIHLLYVSPTQIYGQLPFGIEGNMTVRVTTPNGFAERSL